MTIEQVRELRKAITGGLVSSCAETAQSMGLPALVCVVSICDMTGISTRIACSSQCDQADASVLEVAVNNAMVEFFNALPEVVEARAQGLIGGIHAEKGSV